MSQFERGDGPSEPASVTFEYLKNPAFRVVHSDGLIGGVTPSGNIHIAFYSERAAFPRKVSHVINSDGSLGGQIPGSVEGREGLVRELDIDVVMSVAVAESLAQWLHLQIVNQKAALQMAQENSQ